MKAFNCRTLIIASFSALFLLSASNYAADTLFDKRFDRWKKQAEQGDKRAQYKLGLAYLRGNETKVNVAEAIKWFIKSANQGYIKAAHKLGLIYYTNKDGSRNYKAAFRWFLKAANKRYAPSQYYIGRMYLEARGVKRDLERALLWAKRAEKQQLIKAQHLITEIEEAMSKTAQGRRAKPATPKKPDTAPQPKVVTQEKKPDPNKPRPEPKKNPPINTISTLFNTKKMVVSGGWNLNGKAAEHMPSTLTRCKPVGNTIKCITGRLKGNTESYSAHYQVETTLWNFRPTGTFNAKFRRNFMFVLPEDPDDPNPPEDMPSLGWEKSHTNIRCRMLAKDKMHCFTDDFKIERYTR